MAEDLAAVLACFHRDVLLPDMERILGSAVGSAEQRLRYEMHTVFDALAHRMDRFETEFEMLKGQSRSRASLRPPGELPGTLDEGDAQDVARHIRAAPVPGD